MATDQFEQLRQSFPRECQCQADGESNYRAIRGRQRILGSGFLGMPGDVTPPSRFVRAAFYKASAPQYDSAQQTVMQCFQILNNFDIPIGIEFSSKETPTDIPSATQWTSAADIRNRTIYYRTMYNSTIRSIDLKEIDFGKVKYQAIPLDQSKEQPVERIKIQ